MNHTDHSTTIITQGPEHSALLSGTGITLSRDETLMWRCAQKLKGFEVFAPLRSHYAPNPCKAPHGGSALPDGIDGFSDAKELLSTAAGIPCAGFC